MLRLDYDPTRRRALVEWDETDQAALWPSSIRRLIIESSEESTEDGARKVATPWWNFISVKNSFFQLCKLHNLTPPSSLAISEEALALVKKSVRATKSYAEATKSNGVPKEELLSKLAKVGFKRKLTDRQISNVCKLAALPAAATFSVPGAGKTTEALANFFFKASPEERLLVIAPKNAFAAWDEQLADCLEEPSLHFERLVGGKDNITKLLTGTARFIIIGYQQLVRVPDLIAAHIAQFPHHVFLDESHRIKSGKAKQTARAVLELSHLPVGKLVMSGTPMPQSPEDLVPQLTFLYPELCPTGETAIENIKPIYVRTNKAQLGLPPVTRHVVGLPMAPMQAQLYSLMRSEVAREAKLALSTRNKQHFRTLGRSVARLLQFISNPSLLSSDPTFSSSPYLSAALAEGDGPKLKYILKKTRELVAQGHKVLIWSSYVRNVEFIASRLADLGAVYIHGGVDAGDEEDDATREGKIKAFHDNKNVNVMVANPAAASEGVSLHRVCHHALYLDRTFNAAHYLQSEDRIHRYGLPQHQGTYIEIVQCLGTVDETVDARLKSKIKLMAEALDDSSLMPISVVLEPSDIDDYESYSIGLSDEDINAILKDIGGET